MPHLPTDGTNNSDNHRVDARPPSENNLSNHVFSDPVDFLKTIRANYDKIAGDKTEGISYNDLIVYGHSAGDSKAGNAAQIATSHFREFAALDHDSHQGSYDSHVTKAELDETIKLLSGDTKDIIAQRRSTHLWHAAGDLAVAVGGAFVAVVGSESGIATVAGGAFALAGLGHAMDNLDKRSNDADVVNKKARADQIIVNSWIHGGAGIHSGLPINDGMPGNIGPSGRPVTTYRAPAGGLSGNSGHKDIPALGSHPTTDGKTARVIYYSADGATYLEGK